MANGKWHAEHREYLRAKSREWKKNNPEKHKAHRQKWYDETREKRNEMRRAYYRKNAEAISERQKQWRKANPEKVTVHYRKNVVTARQWRKENPVMARTIWHRRRELVRSTLDKAAVNVLAQLISSASRLNCGICGKNMPKSDRTIDHVIPLSKGGTGDIWNLRVVHFLCNCRKAAEMPDELNFAGEPERIWNTNPRSANIGRTRKSNLKTPKQRKCNETI